MLLGENSLHKTLAKVFFALPKEIAKFLNLPNASNYSGHSTRRTAATWMANSGVSLLQLKKFGRWKSDTVAQEYYDSSLAVKKH